MRILVTFALETEFAPWRAMRTFRRSSSGSADTFLAEIDGAEIAVVLTGAGPRQAVRAASQALRSDFDSLNFCISSGLAGALRPEYKIGDVLVARSVFSELPQETLGSQILECSGSLVSFAADLGATVVRRFYTADRVVARVDEKQHLGETADAVEMESFEILSEATASGVPAVAIRAISDAADEELPMDMNQVFTDEGQVSIPRVVGQVARHPQALPGLIKLGQQSKRAAESLAGFLDRYVVAILERARNLDSKTTAASR
jgi:adenosylhomocysteine nucleosidase